MTAPNHETTHADVPPDAKTHADRDITALEREIGHRGVPLDNDTRPELDMATPNGHNEVQLDEYRAQIF